MTAGRPGNATITNELSARFEKQFGRSPEAAFFSPGRINLIGEHTDYNAGWVLPVAINLGNDFLVSMNQQSCVRIFSVDYAEEVTIGLDEVRSQAPQQHWQDYFVGVMRELIDRPGELPGLDVLVSSTMPVGGGLSSSASITTGFATVLNEFWALACERERLAVVGQKAENNYVGLACGILDPFAIVMGREGCALALDCGTMEWEHVPFPADLYNIVAVNTGVSRRLAGSDYNKRREECGRALSLLRKEMHAESLSDVTVEALEKAGALQQDEVARRRARHVVTENIRVRAAVAALKSGDIEGFGRQLVASHESLRDDYEVSCRELDIMVAESLQLPGVVGAKMTGAGFGGCIVAVVAKSAVEDFVAELGERYKRKSGLEARCYVCSPASGVSRLALQ